jgi:hypothetical protein
MSDNGNRTTTEWLISINDKIDRLSRDIVSKLETKATNEDLERIEGRVDRVESKTDKLAIKQAGIAGTVSLVFMWFKAQIFGG